MQNVFSCFASAAFGLEGLVAAELRGLRVKNVSAENGGVRFSASAEELFLCNLKLHYCDRVYIIAAEQKCFSFEDLFQLVISVPWEEYTEGNEAINISAKCARSKLMSPRDCQSITKKAMIERIRRTGRQSFFPENGESFPVQVSVHSDIAKVMINTSGEALSRRGYRTWNGEAPIRETLAAALVCLSPWKESRPLYDPCCGTGTILIEAASLATHRAPGYKRAFAMESFFPFRNLPFNKIRSSVISEFCSGSDLYVRGSDLSEDAVELARKHIRQAELTDKIHVSVCALQQVELQEENGVFICNPPYGERLSDQKACRSLYRDLRLLRERHPTWAMCAISSDPSFERAYGRKADKKRRLYNGRLECTYYIYY